MSERTLSEFESQIEHFCELAEDVAMQSANLPKSNEAFKQAKARFIEAFEAFEASDLSREEVALLIRQVDALYPSIGRLLGMRYIQLSVKLMKRIRPAVE